MTNEHQLRAPEDIAKRLLPEGLSHLLAERPLLWSESQDEYDALLGEMFAELDPKGIIEVILAKDVVDYIWEARRMRRLKAAALDAEVPAAAGRLLDPPYNKDLPFGNTTRYRSAARAAFSGVKGEEQFLLAEMAKRGLSMQDLRYEALKGGLNVITALDNTVIRLERRRDQLLKQLGDRREAIGAMAKRLVEQESVETIDASPVN